MTLSVLDAFKAFDRVSQHRQNEPGLLAALVHLCQLTYPCVLTCVTQPYYNMVMHVNIQGYQILLRGGLAPKFSPFLFLNRDWFP